MNFSLLNGFKRSIVSIDFCFLPPTTEEVNAIAHDVCLSVCLCLLARLLKNACMDLDDILRVDRCRNMDELDQVACP